MREELSRISDCRAEALHLVKDVQMAVVLHPCEVLRPIVPTVDRAREFEFAHDSAFLGSGRLVRPLFGTARQRP
ncbi:hypothetical protein GCM10022214_25810 [Actinomadura miaoliensis]|uniref:Uncharacterized protein n=1 Tax=Actinomadura miaoliensis TaxID=430685 RepID=A0ABP7VKQ9_9ACTN